MSNDERGIASRIRSVELNPTAVRALAVVALIVAVVAALVAWRARPQVVPLAPAMTSTATAASSSSAGLVVAVSGLVHRPGLVRLPSGARVADAIEAAGGALPGTDLSMLNLARKLTDGELIVVGLTAPAAEAGGSAGGGAPAGPVNLNTATIAQLQTLPGIGPVLAERIIAYRDQNGGFKSVADLRKVTGIGDARYAELKDQVTV